MMVWVAFVIVIVAYLQFHKVYHKYWMNNLDVSIFFQGNCACEGESTKIQQVIRNDKLLPLPILEVFFHLDKGLEYKDMSNAVVSDFLYRRDVFSVGGKKKISRTLELHCKKRGYYTLDEIELMTYDVFIQYKELATKKCFQEFYVYPRKVSRNRIVLPYRQIMGDLMARKDLQEDPFSFAGLRDYTPQDSMNAINWKASAKAQDFVVNLYDSSKKQRIMILLDTYENKSVANQDLNEESIRIASAIIEHLLLEGILVTLKGNARDRITKEILEMKEMDLSNLTHGKQRLATLECGYEESLVKMLQEEIVDQYVVLISKNLEFQEVISETIPEFFWIIPYQYKEPKISVMKGSYLLWELEMNNIG
ncbi:MAG: DUF58 domain-containing protein [Eubacteriales bacterium]